MNVLKFSDKNFCPAKQDDILMVMSDLPNGKVYSACAGHLRSPVQGR